MASAPSARDAATRVSRTLEELGDALAAARLERLLELTPVLAAAVSELTIVSRDHGSPIDAGDVLPELAAARAALARCRRLGAVLDELVAMATIDGSPTGYTRTGRDQPAARASSVSARV